MFDYAFELAVGVVLSFAGWWQNTIWLRVDKLASSTDAAHDVINKRMDVEHANLYKRLYEMEVLVHGHYLRRDEFEQKIDRRADEIYKKMDQLYQMLHSILEKLDRKADR